MINRFTDLPPAPKLRSEYTAQRWEHTALRHRMLTGCWREDLNKAKKRHVSEERDEHWGSGDISANTFRSIVEQISGVSSGIISNSQESAEDFINLVIKNNFWTRMQNIRPLIVGLNECVVRPNLVKRGGKTILTFREVTPNRIEAEADPEIPSKFMVYRELLLLQQKGKPHWVWEVFDLADKETPLYYLEEDGKDVTSLYLGQDMDAFSGINYNYSYSDGTPFIPAALYHSMDSGKLFSPYHGIELIEGTMTLGVFNTFFVHCMRDASWEQRGVINARIVGQVEGSFEADPAVVLNLEGTNDNIQPQTFQWNSAANLPAIVDAMGQFEHRIAEYAGISPSDIQRTSNGDARSGYAIALSNAGKREAQRKFEPMFRLGDIELLEMTAAMVNRELGTNYPETGYTIQYHSVPLSSDEKKAMREDIQGKLDMGLISPIDAYLEYNPGLTREEAEIALLKIAEEKNRIYNLINQNQPQQPLVSETKMIGEQ